MEWLLGRMSAAEFWVWGWLSSRYLEGGNETVTISRNLQPALYSRKQLTRILRGLELKKFLVIDRLPINQHEELVVTIKTVFCIDKYVPAEREAGHGGPGGVTYEPSLRFARTFASRQPEKKKADGSTVAEVCRDLAVSAAPQLSLSSKSKDLKALLGMGQTELMREIMAMDGKDVLEIGLQVFQAVPRPRARKPSEWAKVYAGIRFLQGGHEQVRKNPQAWVEGVARRAHEEMEGRYGSKHDQKAVANHHPAQRAAANGSFHRSGS